MADQEAFNKLNELLKTVTNPGLRASLQAQANALAKEQGIEIKKRPALWGKAYLVTIVGGKESREEYDSPAALLRSLGLQKAGAESMVQPLERVGYKVSSNGPPEKGLPFLVRRVDRLTPMRPRGGTYRIERPEVTITPRRAGPPVERYETPFCVVKDVTGKTLYWENAIGKRLPEELWPKYYPPIPPGELLVAEPGSLPMPPALGPPLPRSMGIFWPWAKARPIGWHRAAFDPRWWYHKE